MVLMLSFQNTFFPCFMKDFIVFADMPNEQQYCTTFEMDREKTFQNK